MTYVIANFKMNGDKAFIDGWLKDWSAFRFKSKDVHVIVAPPATYLTQMAGAAGIELGGQDCSSYPAGAYTGDVSAAMLKDCGAKYVLIGHSECRQHAGDDAAILSQKFSNAMAAGLVPIYCIGETLDQRLDVERILTAQLDLVLEAKDPFLIAYEPVWAIGSGQTPSADEINKIHIFIKDFLSKKLNKKVAVLYGGSVNPEVAASLQGQSAIDGLLVGGASLKVDSFVKILHNFCK